MHWRSLDLDISIGNQRRDDGFSARKCADSQIARHCRDEAKPPLNRAYRRASRKSFLMGGRSKFLYQEGRSLTELPGVGPYLEKVIRTLIEGLANRSLRPATQRQFLHAHAGPFHSKRARLSVERGNVARRLALLSSLIGGMEAAGQ